MHMHCILLDAHDTQKCTSFNKIWAQAVVKVLVDLKKNDTDGSKRTKTKVREKKTKQNVLSGQIQM